MQKNFNEKYVLIKDDGLQFSNCIIFESKEDLIKYKSMANVTALDRTKLCNVPMFKSDIEKGDDLTFDKVVTGIEVKEGEWSKLEEFTDNFHISNHCDNISFVKPLTAYYSDGKLSELEEGDCFITCVDENEDTNTQNTDLSIDKTFTLFYDNEILDKVYVCTTYDGRCKLINCDIVLYKEFEKSAFKKQYHGKSNLFVIEECKKVTDELYKKYYDDIIVSVNDCITNLVKLKNIIDDFHRKYYNK